MRVGKRADRVADLQMVNLAQASAQAIIAAGDVSHSLPRFLIALSDCLQTPAATSQALPRRHTEPLTASPASPASPRRPSASFKRTENSAKSMG
jgi:hypothetical protein